MVDLHRKHSWQLDAALAQGVHSNPFSVPGPHDTQEGRVIRSFLPGAMKVEVLQRSDSSVLSKLEPTNEPGLFEKSFPNGCPIACESVGLTQCRRRRIPTPSACCAVWAPNATRVAVVGDFNSWDRRRHPMRLRYGSGVWKLFVPRVASGSSYKYDILGPGARQP
jgi:1,4-alpha-glucan branching enzyme